MIDRLYLTQNDLRTLFNLIVIFCLLYSRELTNFNVSIDDEVLAFSSSSHFAEMGRWVHPLIRETLFPQPVAPSIGILLFAVSLSLGYLYTTMMFGVRSLKLFHYILWGAYSLFPTWIAQLEFSANIIPLGLGMLAVSMAAYLSADPEFRIQVNYAGRVLLVSSLCAVAIGAYQSLLTCYLALSLGWQARNFALNPGPLLSTDIKKYISSLTTIMALAVILWLIIAKLVIGAYDLEVSEYGKSFIGSGIEINTIPAIIRDFIDEIYLLYYGFWADFGSSGWIFILALGAGVFLASNSLEGIRRHAFTLTLILIIALPPTNALVSGHKLPLRTFLAAPFSFYITLLLAYDLTRQSLQRLIVLVLTGLVALQGLYINSIYQARSWAIQKHDLLLVAAINTEIINLGIRKSKAITEIDFHGFIKPEIAYPEIPTVAGGGSFFEWDGGQTYRIVNYLQILGLDAYSMTTPAKRDNIQKYYMEMPTFPEKGYIKVVDNVVLVNLSR